MLKAEETDCDSQKKSKSKSGLSNVCQKYDVKLKPYHDEEASSKLEK